MTCASSKVRNVNMKAIATITLAAVALVIAGVGPVKVGASTSSSLQMRASMQDRVAARTFYTRLVLGDVARSKMTRSLNAALSPALLKVLSKQLSALGAPSWKYLGQETSPLGKVSLFRLIFRNTNLYYTFGRTSSGKIFDATFTNSRPLDHLSVAARSLRTKAPESLNIDSKQRVHRSLAAENFYKHLQAGKIDRSKLSGSMNDALTNGLLKTLSQQLSTLGTPEWTYIGKNSSSSGNIMVFQLTFRNLVLYYSFGESPGGTIFDVTFTKARPPIDGN